MSIVPSSYDEFSSILRSWCRDFVTTFEKVCKKFSEIENEFRKEAMKTYMEYLEKIFINMGILVISKEEIEKTVEMVINTMINHFKQLCMYKSIWMNNLLIVAYPSVIMENTTCHYHITVPLAISKLIHEYGETFPILKVIDYCIAYPQVITLFSPTVIPCGKEFFNTLLLWSTIFVSDIRELCQALAIKFSSLGFDINNIYIDRVAIYTMEFAYATVFTNFISKVFPNYFTQGGYVPKLEKSIVVKLSKIFPLKIPIEIEDEVDDVIKKCKFEYSCIETMLKRKYCCFKLSEIY